MRLRLARPSMLVDIGRLSDLSYIREDGDAVAIGALTRHHDVANSEVLQELCPIVAHTAGEIGDPQVRHMGTIGGSVAHADPASDMPTVLLALDAQSLVARGRTARRARSPAARLLQGAVHGGPGGERGADGDPRAEDAGAGWSYMKFHRRAQDWAIVGVAAVRRTAARTSR